MHWVERYEFDSDDKVRWGKNVNEFLRLLDMTEQDFYKHLL